MNVNEVVLMNQCDKAQKPPDITDFSNICRICLHLITDESCKTIHDEECKLSLKSLLEVYTFLKISDDEDDYGLPEYVCSDCVDFLIDMHTFRCKVKINDHLLRTIQKNAKDKIPDPSDNNPVVIIDTETDEDEYIPTLNQLSTMEHITTTLASEKLGIFRCTDCHLVFNTRPALAAHRKQHKAPKQSAVVPCPECGKQYKNYKLKDHLMTHTGERPFACDSCPHRAATKYNLQRHMLTHVDEKPHNCEVCGKGFILARQLKDHLHVHFKSSEIDDAPTPTKKICEYCGKECMSRLTFKLHMRKMHNADTDGNPLQPGDDEGDYKCQEPGCKKTYKIKFFFDKHLAAHASPRLPRNCKICGKTLFTASNYNSHMWFHSTSKKQHKCTICAKVFRLSASLKMHMLIHEGKKPHVCKICNKAFRQPTQLRYHLTIHNGEKKYVCEYCGRRFALNGNLTVHRRTHTGEKPYHCSMCTRSFYDSSSCRKHERTHTILDIAEINPDPVKEEEVEYEEVEFEEVEYEEVQQATEYLQLVRDATDGTEENSEDTSDTYQLIIGQEQE